MTRGIIPDENPTNIQEQLLLKDAKAGNGIPIQGGMEEPLGDHWCQLKQKDLIFKKEEKGCRAKKAKREESNEKRG